MKLFHVPFGYWHAAYCSVMLSFHKLAWCTISNVLFWLLCWKRQLRGAQRKMNALLYRLYKLASNFSCWNFSVSGFGVLKVYVLVKGPSCEKRGRKLSYLRNWYVITVYFLCISTNKSTGCWCYVWENYKFQHFQSVYFSYLFICKMLVWRTKLL